MLALGMALMTKPKWLLLDEPSTGLAPVIVRNVMRRLADIDERTGVGLIVVEQNVPATLKDDRASRDTAVWPDRVPGIGEGTEQKYGSLEMVLSSKTAIDLNLTARACRRRNAHVDRVGGGLARRCYSGCGRWRRAGAAPADNIAATVAAEAEPRCGLHRQSSLSVRPPAEATVFNRTAASVDRYATAAANGPRRRGASSTRGYRLALAHAGACILLGLLAEAEAAAPETLQVSARRRSATRSSAVRAQAFPFAAMTVHLACRLRHARRLRPGSGILRGYDADMPARHRPAGASMVFAGPYNHALEGGAWCAISGPESAGRHFAADLAPLGLVASPRVPMTSLSAASDTVDPQR